jgi:glycosyltransferase involved in cell wall biosynthesis
MLLSLLLRMNASHGICGISSSFPEGQPRTMQDPAVTAIIPLYNGAAFIREALSSVLAQTSLPARIIVVDDGSTDNGAEIVTCMASDHDISLIHKRNGGQASARNLGVLHAHTPLIALLDQDDIWYPNHLQELIKPFRETRYPELGWVYSNLDEIDEDGNMVTRCCLDSRPDIEHPKRSLAGCLSTDMFTVPTATLINRKAFEAVGGFDERLIGYEDDDLFLRMFRQGYDNVYLKNALAKWRVFPASASHSPHMRRSRMTYLRKLLKTFPPHDAAGTHYWRRCLTPRFFPMLLAEYRQALRSGNQDALRTAVDDLRLLVPYLRRRSRFLMTVALPIMVHELPATMAVNLADQILPVIRQIIRLAVR